MKKTTDPVRRQEITDFYHSFYGAYSNREWDTMITFLSEGITAIGSGPDEDCTSSEIVLERMKREFEQAPEPVKYSIKKLEVFDICPDASLVMAIKDLELKVEGKPVHFMDNRTSAVVVKENGGWKLAHGHFSQPDISMSQQEGERLRERNRELENEAESRTRELSLRNEELEKMNDIKNRLFYTIAHDLKGPFNNIIGFSQLLNENIEGYSQEDIRSSIYQIYRLGRRTFDMLENLLFWSKAETGSLDYHPTYIRLIPFVEEVKRYLSAEAKDKELNIEYDIPSNLVAYADRNLLNTILRNLLHNAIKFSNTGGNIRITAESGDSEVLVSVEDEGIGIDEQLRQELFDGMYNESRRGTSMEKGTGLGLVLSRSCVERHGGRIWFESEKGRGSSFFFALPKVMPKSVDELFSEEDQEF